MSDSREQFEAWYLATFWQGREPDLDMLARDQNDGYVFRTIQERWDTWQASRQALVVELPAKISHLPHCQVGNGFVLPEAEQYDEAIDDCRAAIEAAGVRVKP
ncbi:hypothetical protein [Pseudomonas oryzihabitans]|uniref:hypothetical protein n=1 Tax=Pseudomonas oryzihabitans TaxID=47885 RepID=UPI00111CA2BD|nr:hypothetical protein [Pseudomonas psychrotolerans]QDD91894.1 hypothetical protein CCZ28_23925 [Pseudomonas psychrotolerans]QDD91950.1 hypothetical protein CCZ28_24235 [Pseudomonas psychrotolerans]